MSIYSYQYSAMSGFLLASIWCSVICLSRIYLGMHSVAVSYYQQKYFPLKVVLKQQRMSMFICLFT